MRTRRLHASSCSCTSNTTDAAVALLLAGFGPTPLYWPPTARGPGPPLHVFQLRRQAEGGTVASPEVQYLVPRASASRNLHIGAVGAARNEKEKGVKEGKIMDEEEVVD